MHCKEIQLQLPDWIHDREHSPLHQEIPQHLETCADCRTEAEQFEKIFTMFHNDTPFVPPQTYFATLLPRVHERITARQKKKKFIRIFAFATPIAATAIIFFAFGSLFQSQQQEADVDLRSVITSLNEQELQAIIATNDFISSERYYERTADIFSDDDREVVRTIIEEQSVVASDIEPYAAEEIILLDKYSDEQAEHIAGILEKQF